MASFGAPVQSKSDEDEIASEERGRVKQFQISGRIEADRTWQIRGINSELQDGNFYNAALFVDGMMSDSRLTSVANTRFSALASLPLVLQPAKDSAKAREIADDIEFNFSRIVPDWFMTELSRWGQYLGFGIGMIQGWNTDEDGVWPELEVFHPCNLLWDWTRMVLTASTQKGLVDVAGGDGRWVCFAPFGYLYGWRRAAMLSVGALYLQRNWTIRDWARASEVYGAPLRKAITPKDATQDERRRFETAVSNIGNEAVILCPQSGPDNKFDVVLMESASDMHLCFKEFKESCDKEIAIYWLGQNLTTEVQGGSFAAAQIHALIQASRIGADAEAWAPVIYYQILREWVRRNYGRPELTPWPQWQIQPVEDATKRAATMKTVIESVAAAKAAGVPLDERRVLMQYDLPVTDEVPEPLFEPPPDAPKPAEPEEAPEPPEERDTDEVETLSATLDAAVARWDEKISALKAPEAPPPVVVIPAETRLKTIADAMVALRQSGADDFVDMPAILRDHGIKTK